MAKLQNMQKWHNIIYLEKHLWAEEGLLRRSAELTPLYVDRYRGLRSSIPTTHTFWELTSIISGNAVLKHHTQHLILQPDTVYLIPPGIAHSENTEDVLDSIWIGLQGSKLAEFSRETLLIRDENLTRSIITLWRTARRRHGYIGSELDGMLTVIMSQFLQLSGRNESNKSHSIQNAVKYLQDNFFKPVSFADLAGKSGYSEGHFYHLFKQLTGETPSHLLTSIRINHAGNLLNNTNFTLSEIARLSGFHDQFYFSRVFKKRLGISPGQFRKS